MLWLPNRNPAYGTYFLWREKKVYIANSDPPPHCYRRGWPQWSTFGSGLSHTGLLQCSSVRSLPLNPCAPPSGVLSCDPGSVIWLVRLIMVFMRLNNTVWYSWFISHCGHQLVLHTLYFPSVVARQIPAGELQCLAAEVKGLRFLHTLRVNDPPPLASRPWLSREGVKD